ncbi:MAG: sugar phosphate isomerase/epimerase [Verrucomicrobiaceae bacterium]|nr:sugar phosphate isomerase/epimerase [Verrucomicrobiaceae bacterium]
MKTMLRSSIAALAALASLSTFAGSFDAPAGLQLYSLRSQFKLRGVAWTLDKVKEMGIVEVELASGVPDLAAEPMRAELDKRGLKAVSSHFGYGRWKNDLDNVVKEAKILGIKYAGCAWIDHKETFDDAECADAIATFNKAGEALAKEGIKFFYHLHGFEFQPAPEGGTLADRLIKQTTPDTVKYQLDVLWIVFPGQNPVKLMEIYPDRWVLMHLKDLKKGVATGALTGHTDVNNNVVLGQGQVDWPSVLSTAQKIGMKHYFIEDESDSVLDQLPKHLDYLKSVKW